MGGVFAALAAVLSKLQLFDGVGFVFLGEVVEVAADGTFKT